MCAAACATGAALYPHDVSVETLSVGAVEMQAHGAGEGGGAAPAVCASPTGAWTVPRCCGASGEREADRLLGSDCSLTFLALLCDTDRAFISDYLSIYPIKKGEIN